MNENISVAQEDKRNRRNRSVCAVSNCTSVAFKDPNLSFFRFPSLRHDVFGCVTERTTFNMLRRQQWILALRIGQPITDRSMVCSKHFKKSDMAYSGKHSRPHLKHTAVPFLSVPLSTDKFKEMSFVTPTKIWEKEDIIALISLYKEEKCLYDRNDPDYSRAMENYNAYKKIRRELITKMSTDCTISQIMNKIQTLKDQYIAEKKRKDKCISSGLTKATIDSLWFFEHLKFLDDYLINETNTYLKKKISSPRKNQSKCLTSNPVSDNKDLEVTKHDNVCKLDQAIVVYLKQKHEEDDADTARENLASNSETNGKIENRKQDMKDQQHERLTFNSETEDRRQGIKDQLFESFASNSEIDGKLDDREQDIKDQQYERFSNSETDEELKDQIQDIEDQQCKSFASNSETDEELDDPKHDIEDQQCESWASNSETDLQSNEENNRNKNLPGTPASETVSYSKETNSLTNSCEREDTFGSYVTSKMKLFRDNPLLYLQTEQAIIRVLNSAHLKNIKSK